MVNIRIQPIPELTKAFATVSLLFLLGLLLPGTAHSASAICQPITVNSSGIQVMVGIDGGEYPAEVTMSNIGFSITDILATELGLAQHADPSSRIVSDTGRSRESVFVDNLPIEVFGNAINAERVTVLESDAKRLTVSLRVVRDMLVQIDFPKSRICFIEPAAMDLRQAQNIDLDSDPRFGRPAVRVVLNNEYDTWLAFSPEYEGGLLLDRQVANALDLTPGQDDQGVSSEFFTTTIDSLEFGPYELGNVPAAYPREDVRSNLTARQQSQTRSRVRRSRETRGRLGIDVMKHFVVTMDLETERMHIFAP
jgi:hypothetical protein